LPEDELMIYSRHSLAVIEQDEAHEMMTDERKLVIERKHL